MAEVIDSILLIILILVIVTMSVSIIIVTLRANKKLIEKSEMMFNRHITNHSAIYKVYDCKNMNIRCVSFKSENSEFDVANAVYWVATHEVYKHYGLDRIIYLDEDRKRFYRPNHGKFDCSETWTIENANYSNGIGYTDFVLKDFSRGRMMEFKLIEYYIPRREIF